MSAIEHQLAAAEARQVVEQSTCVSQDLSTARQPLQGLVEDEGPGIFSAVMGVLVELGVIPDYSLRSFESLLDGLRVDCLFDLEVSECVEKIKLFIGHYFVVVRHDPGHLSE
jgi:hypothetical protein